MKQRVAVDRKEVKPRSMNKFVMNDVEWCYPSAIIPDTKIIRPDGCQLYSIVKVNVFCRSVYQYMLIHSLFMIS